MHDPALRTRRPILFESFVETSDVEAEGGDRHRPTAARRAARRRRGRSAKAARPPRSLAPPKDYEGIRLGPYKYIAWPDGEKELYDINKDPYELNNLVKIPNFFPIRNFLHARTAPPRGLRRPRPARNRRRNSR